MPFVHSITNSDGSITHVWAVNETVSDLMLLCRRRGIDTSLLRTFKATNRRIEQLVERLLLHIIFGHEVTLLHTPEGVPHVEHSSMHLSITHTTGLLAIAQHHSHPVGVDAERVGPRVLRVRSHFLTAREQQFIEDDDIIANLIAWTAKEALFKVAEDPDAVMTSFELQPFRVVDEGVVNLAAHYRNRTFTLTSTVQQGYVITLAYENENQTEV
ncbi:MAG: 4'-phosphopantetheinyl transferase superfamily protein [Muribaculaceae bacterium]|nr:4'-phosphopantetheinyl transferase superfamily protein [Muribaculaceae bacterium]